MAHGVRDDRTDETGIEHHDRAGDGRHAAGHESEQRRAGHAGQIGPDQQRRLGHADEDIGGGAQPQRSARAQGAAQQPGESAHQQRQDAPVKEQGRERADDQDQRQGAEGEHEAVMGIERLEGRGGPAEIAEDQLGAGLGGLLHRQHQPVQAQKERLDRWQFQQRQRQQKLECESRDDEARTHGAAVLAQQPGACGQHAESE